MAELTPKTINELPLASEIGANDLMPISSGGAAKRVRGSSIVNNSGVNYCKMPDGTLLCWGRTDTIQLSDLTPKSGNGYTYYEAALNISFAVPFVARPYLIVSKSGGSIATVVWQNWTAEKITEIDFATVGEATSTQVSADWIAIGRWK